MSTRQMFALALLAKGDWLATTPNVDAIVAWGIAEGSHAENNMLDTTESWPNATDYNSAHVKNYETWEDGIAATYATLMNGRYTAIVEALQHGNNALSVANAVGGSPWGAGNFSPEVEWVQTHREEAYSQPITSSSTSNPPVVDKPQPVPSLPTEQVYDVNLETLQLGSTGPQVKTVQSLLNGKASASLTVDGEYGPMTEESVKGVQTLFHLTVDGVVGAQTWGVLLVL